MPPLGRAWRSVAVRLGDEPLDAGVSLLDEGQHRLAVVVPLCQQLERMVS